MRDWNSVSMSYIVGDGIKLPFPGTMDILYFCIFPLWTPSELAPPPEKDLLLFTKQLHIRTLNYVDQVRVYFTVWYKVKENEV